MDARAELALAELVRAVVSQDLDKLHARLERHPSPPAFSYHEYVAPRRRVVVELRASGLSIAAIGLDGSA